MKLKVEEKLPSSPVIEDFSSGFSESSDFSTSEVVDVVVVVVVVEVVSGGNAIVLVVVGDGGDGSTVAVAALLGLELPVSPRFEDCNLPSLPGTWGSAAAVFVGVVVVAAAVVVDVDDGLFFRGDVAGAALALLNRVGEDVFSFEIKVDIPNRSQRVTTDTTKRRKRARLAQGMW